MFSRRLSRRPRSGNVPVYLNVYDLTSMNGYIYWFGLGIYHSGVEVHGVEYAFGAHEYPTSGVFEVEPRQCPGFTFRKSIFIGTTDRGPRELRDFMEQLAGNYNGDTYHLIVKNCNHFCNDICLKLTGNQIPRWVNRLARIDDAANQTCKTASTMTLTLSNWQKRELMQRMGNCFWLLCNCVLPVGLHVATVPHTPEFQLYEGEKKQLSSSFSRFSGTFAAGKAKQRSLSVSSVFLNSPLKGGVLHWESKGENMV